MNENVLQNREVMDFDGEKIKTDIIVHYDSGTGRIKHLTAFDNNKTPFRVYLDKEMKIYKPK